MIDLLYISLAFLAGGVLKGAMGVGAPIIVVPVLALFYDVPTAVVIFIVPNILSNVWQYVEYRRDCLPVSFTLPFILAGVAGAVIGTVMLSALSGDVLSTLVAVVLLFYIVFRLARPDWQLAHARARQLAVPAGVVAGILQGASGISAPVSITFLNAMRLERAEFVATISAFFLAMALIQLPMMIALHLMDAPLFRSSCAALLPMLAGMPLGAMLARRISREAFDRTILGMLIVLTVKLIYDVVV